jgi:replicative DNA helicase
MKMSAEEIAAGWESVGRQIVSPLSDYRMYTPLGESVDSFVRWAQSPQERINLGINKIDAEMRGIAPGEIAMVLGFAHGGKTLLLLHMLRNNRDKHVALFIPDEPRELVLIKLTCITHNIDARVLEQRIADHDQEAINLLHKTANEDYPNLAVFDQSLSASDMERGYNELCEVWNQAPELVVVDFLDLVQAGETVPDKANFLKSFGRKHDVPMLVLHQTSRHAGADGRKPTMSSGAFGGEQQATAILGVRRRKYEIQTEINELIEKLNRGGSERSQERLEYLRYEAKIHEHTVTVNLLKNKRPAGQLVDDVDFELNAMTGRIRELNGELPRQYKQMGLEYEHPYE